jgi:glycine cleavage system H protein
MKTAVLCCNGLDKVEGSVAREVALRLSEETGAEIICPVALNRAPTRYKKTLAADRLIVVDGCATRCASKLAAASQATPVQKVLVSDAAKSAERPPEPSLRLGPEALLRAQAIVDEIRAAEAAVQEAGMPADAATPPEMAAGAGSPEVATAFVPPTEFEIVTHDKYEFRIPLRDYCSTATTCG